MLSLVHVMCMRNWIFELHINFVIAANDVAFAKLTDSPTANSESNFISKNRLFGVQCPENKRLHESYPKYLVEIG